MKKQKLVKIIVPAIYLIAITLMAIYARHDQSTHLGKDSPLYRNLMDSPAYIRRGFDPSELTKIPALDTGKWFGFKSKPLIVKNSFLPNLPKRTFLSPRGYSFEEFTIIIPVEIDEQAISLLEESLSPESRPMVPGIFLAIIGENWEVFFNGTPVRSEMRKNAKGQITEERALRSVSFPVARTLFKQGTNIIAIRIIGDPGSNNTGLWYNKPYYIDEYRIIQGRQNKSLLSFFCSIFGFSSIFCFLLFFYLRNKLEYFYLYFGTFSILLCINIIQRQGLLVFITDSSLNYRLEFASLMLAMPFFYMFIESLGREKITKPVWVFLAFSFYCVVTQFFFCNAYVFEILYVWLVVNSLFFTFVICYDIIYFYLFDKKRNIRINDTSFNTVIIYAVVSSVAMYVFGVYEAVDILFFRNSYSIFPYSLFIIQIAITFAILERFAGMYKKLERSNIMLEADFARSIISSGQKHYQKMYAMYDTLRILRHDYKYHMKAIGDLVKAGDIDNVKGYLTGVQAQIPENDMMIFCSNPIINGLLGNYAERCTNLNINYRFQIAIPDTLSIGNHEMCIIIGNLLENAVEACQKIDCCQKIAPGEPCCNIELEIKTQGMYIAIMVKNNFSGEVVKKNGHPVSTKENGGFGLQSVRIVAGRYNGHVHPKWDKDTFTMYVMLKMKTTEEIL